MVAAVAVSTSLLTGCSTVGIGGAFEMDSALYAGAADFDTLAIEYGQKIRCYESGPAAAMPSNEERILCTGLAASAIAELAADRITRYESEDAVYAKGLIERMRDQWKTTTGAGTIEEAANGSFLHSDLSDLRRVMLIAITRAARRERDLILGETSEIVQAVGGTTAGAAAGATGAAAAVGAVTTIALPKIISALVENTGTRVAVAYLRKTEALTRDIGNLMGGYRKAPTESKAAQSKRIKAAIDERLKRNLDRVDAVINNSK